MRRAVDTATLSVAATTSLGAPTPAIHRWAELAERHYGALTGRIKREIREQVGASALSEWRNSSTTAPPPIEDADLRRLRSQGWPTDTLERCPVRSESLDTVRDRVRPFVRDRLLPHLHRGVDALVIAHGNSLRAAAAELAGLDADELRALRIAAGGIIICQLTSSGVSLAQPPRS